MKFSRVKLDGAFVLEPQLHCDERGFFARTYCAREFEEHGLVSGFVQCSVSYNHIAGTLRGLHYQEPPAAECKLVRCTAGALLDVIVDLRPQSPTYLEHFAVELSAQNRLALYIPENFAHGFQTLEPATEVFYQISQFYSPELARGLVHDEPKLGIKWPLPVSCISQRDKSWERLK